MSSNIRIKESLEDKKSWFNIKRFRIGITHFERPEKSLDAKYVNKNIFDSITKRHTFKFCETTKTIRSFQIIKDLYKEDQDYKINEFFCKRNWLADMPSILNFTFEFNPFKHVRKIENMSGFFDQYYGYAKLFLSIPNIRTKRVSSKPYKNEIIIDAQNYIKFVDSAYSILNTKNNKPIFVPVSLRMPLSDLDLLIGHYLKKEYYYYWFDFEGKAVNESSLSRLRHVFRHIREAGYFKSTVSHFTNVKREIISNPESNESPASDILCSIAGANIIGTNREPRRAPPEAAILPAAALEHKARRFDEKSYFYLKTKDPNYSDKIKYTCHNAAKLDKELENQSEFFLTNNNLDKLLENKKMLNSYRDGLILRELNSKSSDSVPISDWF